MTSTAVGPLRALVATLGLAVLLTACATSRPIPWRADAAQQRGHDFAIRRCSGCHTVGRDDGGAQDGPAFRRLAMQYDAISLKHRFAEVSAHGFDRMPPVEFTPREAADLLAYLDSLHGN